MRKFRTPFTVNEVNKEIKFTSGVDTKGESKTIPDQSLSLRQLILRQRSGQYVPEIDAQYEEYKESVNFPDTTRMSKTELIDFSRGLTEFIKEKRKVLETYAKDLKEKQQEINPINNDAQNNEVSE